jgi:predicted RNase H-like nuclease
MTGWVAGIDGCRAGWIAVIRHAETGAWHFRFAPALADIVDADERPRVIAIDMPTGFPDRAERGGRACERDARRLLVGKTSSVFPTPCRVALDAGTHAEASAVNRRHGDACIGLTRQAFHLFPKMRELDALLRSRPRLRRRIFEAHPELAFLRMNGGRPVLTPKRTADGLSARQRLLAMHGFAEPVRVWTAYCRETRLLRAHAAPDDALDAASVCRTALLIHSGAATHLPDRIKADACGLPMAIWY